MPERKILGLIPARGGSKGIPKKNLYLFNGKPLLEWTIKAAKESNLLNKIILSTDDENIATFAKKKGIEVPFLRNPKLAQDDSLVIDTVMETIDFFNNYDDILLLQPTSPLRTKEDIERIINIHHNSNAGSVVSVREAKENPTLLYEINEIGYLNKCFKKLEGTNRQSFSHFYMLNGALYISTYEHLKKYKSFLSKETIPYIMPLERSLDIDSLLDIKWGEFFISHKKDDLN